MFKTIQHSLPHKLYLLQQAKVSWLFQNCMKISDFLVGKRPVLLYLTLINSSNSCFSPRYPLSVPSNEEIVDLKHTRTHTQINLQPGWNPYVFGSFRSVTNHGRDCVARLQPSRSVRCPVVAGGALITDQHHRLW